MTKAEELALYFKSQKGCERILNQIRIKYLKSGELNGIIVLNDAENIECSIANAILEPKTPFNPPIIKFRAKDFEAGLKRTKFDDVLLKEAVEIYFGGKLVSNKEKRLQKAESELNFWSSISEEQAKCPCLEWINAMKATKSYGYLTVLKQVHESYDAAVKILINVCNAVNSRIVSSEPIQLAVLSAEITGDSHYFDSGNTAGRLLIKSLAFMAEMPEDNYAEAVKEIYSQFGIESDIISGTVAAVGIRLYKADGYEHSAYKAFADSKEICLISTASLTSIASANAESKIVFVVENPTVFTELSGTAAANNLSLLCTSGQIKLSGIKLIDMLVKANCQIYYAGDFDPEGLQIADRLLRRYNSPNIHTWRMNADDYSAIDKGDLLSDVRLKKLNRITSPELASIVNMLKTERKAAYQELLISQMKSDMVLYGGAIKL